jgi:hypothetical protein
MIDPFDYKESEYDFKRSKNDFKVVSEEVKEKICEVIWEKIKPTILASMSEFDYPKVEGRAIKDISYEDLCSYRGSLEPLFQKEQQYDLYLMQRYTCLLEEGEFYKIYGKKLVGAAIRISKWIGAEEYAGELEEIVEDIFIPEEHPDPKALAAYFCH